MLYAWSSSNNAAVTIDIKQKQYFLYLNIYTTVFAWGDVNTNETKHNDKDNLYDRT